ncbi:hypothetical protein BDN72DRAFT_826582 [Pluteus cervinus]|uniref:Uncharacterized protein n=1 Tax=Pluteus cervinus TaxID=181527 RepID=A0ACD3AC74_9AGAR|nr:hypothetical protein BDN72DRAFT_826582 [Pluteus cervinus]
MMHQTSPYISEAREIAIQKLDDEIRSLTERLYHLKCQRNTYSITYTLPIEVLSEIFLLTQADRGASMIDLWLQVTHLSQHWRKVALECAELWCEIGSLTEAAIQAFLARSGGRSISVNLIDAQGSLSPQTSYYSEGLLAHIFGQTFRIQSLSLEGSEHFDQVLPYLTSKPAPKLETLRISAP